MALSSAILVACSGSAVVFAEDEAPHDATADSGRSITVLPETADPNTLALQCAAMEQGFGNLRGVIENLESIELATEPTFPEADRAAFLLGNAYLQLGSVERFIELASYVSSWSERTPYTEWIAYSHLLLQVEGAETNEAQARRLRVAGRAADAFATYLTAQALAAAGQDDTKELAKLSGTDTSTELGRTLAGAAIVQLASRALSRGEDPRDLLELVPAGSRYHSRARHLMGIVALEQGESAEGVKILEALLAEDPGYEARRDVSLALAAETLDEERWQAAYEIYKGADDEWAGKQEALERLLAAAEFDTLWSAWMANDPLSDAVTLDAMQAQLRAGELAGASADLTETPNTELPALDAPSEFASNPWSVPPPAPEARRAVREAERNLDDASFELERTGWEMEIERHRLDRKSRYFAYGGEQIGHEKDILASRAAMLDSLHRKLRNLLAKLRSVRDRSIDRVAMRTQKIMEDCEQQLVWIAAMRHFYVDGPNGRKLLAVPPAVPNPDALMIAEEELIRAIQTFTSIMAEDAPGLIAQSHDDAWGPNLPDRAEAQRSEVQRYLAWAARLETSIDSTIASTTTSEKLLALESRVASLERSTDSLRTAYVALRDQVAADAVQTALTRMQQDREAIDYGLAASSYGLSLSLAQINPDQAAGPNSDVEKESSEAKTWRDLAIAGLHTFLERHPESFARGEMRFRLADLVLIDARQSFREKMAQFIRAQERGASMALPILDHGTALGIYQTILEEDRDFTHIDAVLFNAGMILADNADPKAERYFEDLVTIYPQSPFGQEAYLRMGDIHFNRKRFSDCISLYERAAAGADTTLKLMALYKMGWAEFNEDRFVEATDAFRSVLDIYEATDGAMHEVDVEDEAESYLIHSLARAGGAKAFRDYFDRVGSRPYEMHLLMAMGQHFRRFSLYSEAADTDKLHIERYPSHSEALVSAQRLTDTYKRWDRFKEAREAQLVYASHFAPGSEWFKTQESDSVKQAGADFAKTCWTTVAVYHHREAAKENSRNDWSEALRLYETVLAYWPEDPEVPIYQLHAGEASFHLGEYEGALDHYAAAAEAGADSTAELALRQRVAVTDAWYEETRNSGEANDELAGAVLVAGDELLNDYPQHAGAEDIVWRQGNLAFAHGWYERAADDFDRMATQYPADRRAPWGASLRADALFRLEKYEEAGAAFEAALASAQRAGNDSLASSAAESIPVCYFRHAESAVAADSTDYERHAELFEKVAANWPEYEHAHLSQYRAGLAYLNARRHEDGVRVMQDLITRFPEGEYVKDAHLHIAKTWEATEDHERAAVAYVNFSERYPDDDSADDAWLKAADLYATAGLEQQNDQLRLGYIERFPDDRETAMEILEEFARRDIEGVTPEQPVSLLLGKKKPRSHLAEYLERAKKDPELASTALIAEVKFLEAEEARAAYDALELTLPLKKSIAKKQKSLDKLMDRYQECVEIGISEWARASAFRIGQSLVGFGAALETSQRPRDLKGDDLLAYEDVLLDESQVFYDRGEEVWAELLKKAPDGEPMDTWTEQAQELLWMRLAKRFFYRPEFEFPLVAGSAPPPKQVPPSQIGSAVDPNPETEKETTDVASGRGDGQ
jgi:tetratricopeptide (TPR) repeat protein